MPDELRINGAEYHLLGVQRSGAAVYRGINRYARVGEPTNIAYDIARHREMADAKYPVARILEVGEYEIWSYFIEESLGTESFRAMFERDYRAAGRVGDAHFSSFTSVAKKLYAAQLKHVRESWDVGEFAHGIRVTSFARELPLHTAEIEAAFVAAAGRLKKLPGVLLHGDCNAANMYEGGIIDLEDSFYGPAGYDQVSALISIEWSPETRDYEFYAQYRFSEDDAHSFYKSMDRVGAKYGVAHLSHYARDLAFCRAIWLSSGMHAWPRTQQWRYAKFLEEYLS